MKKYKVQNLTGALLDAAVAKAAGISAKLGSRPGFYKFLPDGDLPTCVVRCRFSNDDVEFRPSTDVFHARQILLGTGISISSLKFKKTGNPVVAALRAFVEKKFGEFVEL